jgi:hypothetical protein
MALHPEVIAHVDFEAAVVRQAVVQVGVASPLCAIGLT